MKTTEKKSVGKSTARKSSAKQPKIVTEAASKTPSKTPAKAIASEKRSISPISHIKMETTGKRGKKSA